IKGREGLFIAAGHEGDGIALSAITGIIACGLIREGKAYTDVSAIDPNRFPLFIKPSASHTEGQRTEKEGKTQ
ncbi:MAG: hypothetical protein LBC67_01585, partial [Spirochaetales bacterium]|nr:hypothetical protein [Spirochaetales bacterium]